MKTSDTETPESTSTGATKPEHRRVALKLPHVDLARLPLALRRVRGRRSGKHDVGDPSNLPLGIQRDHRDT